MCILFIYTNPRPPVGGYRLIVASNRDESYNRPAKRAFLCRETGIIGVRSGSIKRLQLDDLWLFDRYNEDQLKYFKATGSALEHLGRDMEPGCEGGMWLGVSTKRPLLKFATLLNVTGAERQPNSLGRGPLVLNYLSLNDSPLEYVDSVKSESYNPFNLVMIELTTDECSIYHHSNSPRHTVSYRGRQLLGFGNSAPDAPFTKVENGKKRFEEIVQRRLEKDRLVDELLKLLKSEESHLPDPELERRVPDRVQLISAIFVKGVAEGYGSRTHSVVLVDDSNRVEFIEHTMKEPIDADNPIWDVSIIKSSF